MELFTPILNQMVYLFAFIIIGYILIKVKALSPDATATLSKLESKLFIPALVLSTFMNNFTVEKLGSGGIILLLSSAILIITAPLAVYLSRLIFSTDRYLAKIATYGLTFSNFGYMGNAIMQSVFPDIFLEYSIFCMPLWVLIYVWGVPTLLIAGSDESAGKMSLKEKLKPLCNPMFAAMIIGIALGLSGLTPHIHQSVKDVITVSGNCMSPIAMLLTGMTIAQSNLIKMLTKWQTYLLSFIRLLAIPSLFILIFAFVPKSDVINDTFLICGLASVAMPLGLNTIVVPKGYGKDTTDAAGMALISHTLSIGTIPLMFLLLNTFVL